MVRVRAAIALVLTLLLAAGIGAFAQTTTKDLNNEYGKGTETTTVAKDGDNTVTTVEQSLKTQQQENGQTLDVTTYNQTVEVRDKAGNVLKRDVTYTYEIRNKGKLVRTGGYLSHLEVHPDGSSTHRFHSDDVDETQNYERHSDSATERDASKAVVGGARVDDIKSNGKHEIKRSVFRDGSWQTIGMAAPPLRPISPRAGDGAAGEYVALPDVAGPSSEILATFEDPNQAGPSAELLVAVEDDRGRSKFFRAVADADHYVRFKTLADTVRVTLFKSFDKDGKPDANAVHCTVARDGVVNGTSPVARVASSGPTITRASSAYERGGGGRGLFSLQTRGLDPSQARVLMDGSEFNVRTLAASDMSVKAQLDDGMNLGAHRLSVLSGGEMSDEVPVDVVALRADPLAPGRPGIVQTLTVHCDGLPPSHPAAMYFQVGGAAQLVDGGELATATVKDGVAQVRIRGVHSGQALVRYKLHVRIPGFWDT